MSFITRPVKPGDLEAIVNQSGQFGYQTTRIKTKQRLQAILYHADHRLLVAEKDMVIAGYIHAVFMLSITSDPFIEITGLVIDEKFRRQGIGKILVEEIIQWAGIRQCSLIRVRSNILRREAHAFYTSIGLSELKIQRVYELKTSISQNASQHRSGKD